MPRKFIGPLLPSRLPDKVEFALRTRHFRMKFRDRLKTQNPSPGPRFTAFVTVLNTWDLAGQGETRCEAVKDAFRSASPSNPRWLREAADKFRCGKE